MRASIDKVIKILKGDKPPDKIWQKAFDLNTSHYHRLCNLNGSPPAHYDLCDYARDIHYQEELQPDLLHYLLPICLNVWRADLLSPEPPTYGSFIEEFSPALAVRADLAEVLGATGYQAVMEFMRDAILDRMDQEVELHFSGSRASPYQWFHALGSFAVIFPYLDTLWPAWWNMETKGHAITALQYTSCLMYEAIKNPMFSPWTGDKGGGAPALYETDGHIYDRGWRSENVSFITSTLSVDYIQRHLDKALQVLQHEVESEVPRKMLHDLVAQQSLLESRIQQLPILLAKPILEVDGWVDDY